MESKRFAPENSNKFQNTFVTYKVTNIEVKQDPADQTYPCPICKYRYDIKSRLIQHLHAHRRDRPGEIFNILHETEVTSNQKSDMSVESSFKCEKCHKSLASRRGLRVHSQKCHKKKRYSNKLEKPVRILNIVKKSSFNLGNQVSLDKIQQKPCVKMQGEMKNFNKEGNLVKYGKQKSVLKQNFETQCDANSETRPISCEIPVSLFDDPNLDEYHLKGDLSSNDPIKCELCNKIFLSKSARRVHYRRHTEEKPFDCEVCGKKYVTTAGLKYHYLSHVKDSEKGVKKSQKYSLTSSSRSSCDAAIDGFDSTTNKLDVAENDKSTFSCKDCPQVFSSENNLAQHRLIHYCSQTYKCGVCHKLFLYYNQLKRHSKTHLKKR